MARTPSINHARYGHFARQRYSKKLLAFLTDTGARLLSSATLQTIVPVAVANAFASNVLTMGTNPSAAQTVTIGGSVYTFRVALTEVKAFQTLTGTGTNPANADTVTIGSKVYTFQTALTNVDGNVLIAGTAAATLTNLFHAINASGGVSGTDYAAATIAHPTVTATNPTGTTVVATSKTVGVGSNTIATTRVGAQVSWGAATLLGGVNAISNEVLIGVANTNSIDNLVLAITAGAGVGVSYSTGTTASPDATASARSGNTTTATSVAAGAAGNSVNVSTTVTAATWATAKLTGGVTASFGPTITATAHTLSNAEGPHVITSSNGTGGLPAGYVDGTFLYASVVDANTVKLFRDAALTQLQTFTSAGTGTIRLAKPSTQASIHDALKRNSARTIAAASDIDNLQ